MMLQFAASADGCGYRVVALLLLAGATGSARVYAQAEDSLQLTWQAPASCPDADDVRARVRALAGKSDPAGAQLRAAGTVTKRSDGAYALTLIIQLDQLVGERTLEARSCEALAGAAAVNLALLLKQPTSPLEASDRPSAADAAGGAQAPAKEETSQPQAAPPTTPNAPRDANTSHARAILQLPRLMFALGPTPAPSFGLSLAGGVALGAWTITAGATWWLPQTHASDRPNTAVHLQRVAASLDMCRSFAFGRLEIAPCAAMSLEHLSARGDGPYVRSATVGATWLAAGLGVRARFPLAGWVNALGGAELKLQAARPRLSIDAVGQVAQLGAVAAELFFGAEWIL